MDRLLAIETFAKVVELGSFSRAAERLNLSASAVSRQVSDLEAHLDVRLMNRTTRRLSLTEAGQSFYEHCVQLLADLEDAEASVRTVATAPKGTLRLTCGVSFGIHYLAPALADFAAEHPDVVFDLDVSDRAVDLVEEGFDLAVRIGNLGQQGSMVARRLGWTQMVCCAAPTYLEHHRARLEKPSDLAAHEGLCYTNIPLPNVWRFTDADGNVEDVKIATRHRANNGQVLASLAVQGFGVVFSPDFIVAHEIRAGHLVPLLRGFRPPRSPIAAVYPSRRHLSAKVRSIVDYLAHRFEREHPWRLDDLVETNDD
ncbi:MAG TPA: LysR family transcriptional regulator [Steroidobacteraceae bacterium]|nr:LysR family transcriptional regulator [Steroidobacteraceae bacterium]